MFIRTERLLLRPLFQEDWREVLAGICDERVISMLARAPWPYSAEHAGDFRTMRLHPKDWHFAITLPGDDGAPLIGQVGLCPYEGSDTRSDTGSDGASGEQELGFWIAPAWQGQGFATEAVLGVIEIARALGIKRIEAGHYLDNPASGRVLRKSGFAETGRIRPTRCAGRNGALLPARRYACELVGQRVGQAA